MVTAESVVYKLQDLLGLVEKATGIQAETVYDAVSALIEGYGQGGANAGFTLVYDMGEFVPDADIQYNPTASSTILHELGDIPQFVLVWTDDFSHLTADDPSPYTTTTSLGYIFIDGLIGLKQRLTSAVSTEFGLQANFVLQASSYLTSVATVTSVSYGVNADSVPTNQRIGLPRFAANTFWRAGVKYRYFVSKAWWDIGGADNAK